jgi:hypothetical protein
MKQYIQKYPCLRYQKKMELLRQSKSGVPDKRQDRKEIGQTGDRTDRRQDRQKIGQTGDRTELRQDRQETGQTARDRIVRSSFE